MKIFLCRLSNLSQNSKSKANFTSRNLASISLHVTIDNVVSAESCSERSKTLPSLKLCDSPVFSFNCFNESIDFVCEQQIQKAGSDPDVERLHKAGKVV